MKTLLTLFVLFFAFTFSLTKPVLSISFESMKDLKEVSINVGIDSIHQNCEIKKEMILNEINFLVNSSPIKINNNAKSILDIMIHINFREPSLCYGYIDFSLVEVSKYLTSYNQSVSVINQIWTRTLLYSGPTKDLYDQMKSGVNDLTKMFINQWHSTN